MATHTPNYGRASALPLSAVLASLPSYPRPVIESLVEKMIDRLDHEDGDLDVEANGDERDFNQAEDDFENYRCFNIVGAGCPVADPGEDSADAEIETWSHADDHPDELLIGRRTPARQLRDN